MSPSAQASQKLSSLFYTLELRNMNKTIGL